VGVKRIMNCLFSPAKGFVPVLGAAPMLSNWEMNRAVRSHLICISVSIKECFPVHSGMRTE